MSLRTGGRSRSRRRPGTPPARTTTTYCCSTRRPGATLRRLQRTHERPHGRALLPRREVRWCRRGPTVASWCGTSPVERRWRTYRSPRATTLTAAFSPDDDTLYTSAGDSALRTLGSHRQPQVRHADEEPDRASSGVADSSRPAARPSTEMVNTTPRLMRTPGGPGGSFVNTSDREGRPLRRDPRRPRRRTVAVAGTRPGTGSRSATPMGVVFVFDARTGRLLASRKVSAAPDPGPRLQRTRRQSSRRRRRSPESAVLLDADTLLPVSKPVKIGASDRVVVGEPGQPLGFRADRWPQHLGPAGRALRRAGRWSIWRRAGCCGAGSFPMRRSRAWSPSPRTGRGWPSGATKGHVLIVDSRHR